MAEMTYRPLGRSGLIVSAVGLGCNAFGVRADLDATRAIVHAAIDVGITFVDVADIYGPQPGVSESMLGEVLGANRDDIVLATKFGMDMQGSNGADHGVRGSRRYIRRAVEASLRRLRTDHIDLYQMHEPDPVTPIQETLTALQELVGEGKVRYVGSSNFAGWQVVDADWVARSTGASAFVAAQNKYSMYDRSAEAELIPACEHTGVGLIPFYPLEYGLLAGRYTRGEPAPEGSKLSSARHRLENADFDRIERFEAFAAERGLTPVQVAIGGLAAQPAVGTVIAGASKPEQVRSNAEAGEWQPSLEDLVALDEVTAT